MEPDPSNRPFLDEKSFERLDNAHTEYDRMGDGTYDICCICGAEISDASLHVVNQVSLCTACARRRNAIATK